MRSTFFLTALGLVIGVGLTSSEANAGEVHVTWGSSAGINILGAHHGPDVRWHHWRAHTPHARDYERPHRLSKREIRWHRKRIEKLERYHRKLQKRAARAYRKGHYQSVENFKAEARKVRRQIRKHRRAFRRSQVQYADAHRHHRHSPRCNH